MKTGNTLLKIWGLVSFLGLPFIALEAQELKPPPWAVGDWWILKSQVYDSGKIVPGAQPRWLPPQSWYFQVETQDSIENQSYFVVAIHPIEENPSPYWFRFWFREDDRYVGRYEMHHPNMASGKRTRNLSAPVIRKNFDPKSTWPFVTSKFPNLPLTLPVFAEIEESVTNVTQERSIRSGPSTYVTPEFEAFQKVSSSEMRTMAEKIPEDADVLSTRSMEGSLFITIQTTSSLVEEQYWNPQLPWCLFGQRIENSVITKRYWLVQTGKN